MPVLAFKKINTAADKDHEPELPARITALFASAKVEPPTRRTQAAESRLLIWTRLLLVCR